MILFLIDLVFIVVVGGLVYRWRVEVTALPQELQHGAALLAAADARATPLVQAAATLLNKEPAQLFTVLAEAAAHDPTLWPKLHATVAKTGPVCNFPVRHARAYLSLASLDAALREQAEELYAALARLDAWVAASDAGRPMQGLQLGYDLRTCWTARPTMQANLDQRRRGLLPLRWLRHRLAYL